MTASEKAFLLFIACVLVIIAINVIWDVITVHRAARKFDCSPRLIRERRCAVNAVEAERKRLGEPEEADEIRLLKHQMFIRYCVDHNLRGLAIYTGDAYEEFKEHEAYMKAHPPNFKTSVQKGGKE